MGCCQSSEPDEYEDERGPLLGSNAGSDRGGQSQNSPENSTGQQNPDEQSALNKILQRASNDLIDISAQAHSADVTEENEAQYRSKHYGAKLNRVTIVTEPRLGYGRTNPYSVLSQPSIPPSDLDLVTQAAQKTAQCMDKVVIHHKEDLVVPFGVP